MKYKEQQQVVSDLRALADFYERPESIALPAPSLHFDNYVSDWGYIPDPENLGQKMYGADFEKSKQKIKKITRALGSCKKDFNNTSLSVVKSIGDTVTLSYRVNREAVCKKVPTGITKVIPSVYMPERVEEEYEWVCDDVSLLSNGISNG